MWVPIVLLLVSLGFAKETDAYYRPGHDGNLSNEYLDQTGSMFEGRMQRDGVQLVNDTGWTEAIVYAGKKQYMKRVTGTYWLLFGACIAFVILLFAWTPIGRRYRAYRRRFRRRRQKRV